MKRRAPGVIVAGACVVSLVAACSRPPPLRDAADARTDASATDDAPVHDANDAAADVGDGRDGGLDVPAVPPSWVQATRLRWRPFLPSEESIAQPCGPGCRRIMATTEHRGNSSMCRWGDYLYAGGVGYVSRHNFRTGLTERSEIVSPELSTLGDVGCTPWGPVISIGWWLQRPDQSTFAVVLLGEQGEIARVLFFRHHPPDLANSDNIFIPTGLSATDTHVLFEFGTICHDGEWCPGGVTCVPVTTPGLAYGFGGIGGNGWPSGSGSRFAYSNGDIMVQRECDDRSDPIAITHDATRVGDEFPWLDGSRVVWATARHATWSNGNWHNWEIYLHDLDTRRDQRITDDLHDDVEPIIVGGWIVWTRLGVEPPNPATFSIGSQIYAYEIATGRTYQVTRNRGVSGQNIFNGRLYYYSREPSRNPAFRWRQVVYEQELPPPAAPDAG